ncbi:MAG TPA: biotin/lipoyl-containing protein [Gemmatimonadales bacterium]|nr:biotin/lipoyl-containing protein [Gemmatimonadales bacterium]
MRYLVEVRGTNYEVRVEGNRVWVDGVEHRAELCFLEASAGRVLMVDGRSTSLTVESGAGRGRWVVYAEGERVEVEVLDERIERTRRTTSRGSAPAAGVGAALKAPMPGLVVRICVEPGQEVAVGTSLVVLEAMKMENELKAAGPGVVDRILVRAGQTVEKGEVLVGFK